MGFEELSHTADWAIRVWSPDLAGLFAEAARAMNALAGVKTTPGRRVRRKFRADGPDAESWLVAFLSELIYVMERESLAFTDFEARIDGGHLTLTMAGAPIASIDKPIKAVTWHELKIQQTERGLETTIVFDV